MREVARITIKVKKLKEKARLPKYKTEGSSGADVYACLEEDITINPGEVILIPTGIAVELPTGWEMQVRPRSGLALRGITVINAPGTIDCDYRGEIGVILINLGREPFTIKDGMRIAQLVVSPTHQAKFVEVKSLSNTERGEGGFGSTGV